MKGGTLMYKNRFNWMTLLQTMFSGLKRLGAKMSLAKGLPHLQKFYKALKMFSLIFILQRLVLAVNKAISDPDTKQVLIETLAYENVNSEYTKVVRLLKV